MKSILSIATVVSFAITGSHANAAASCAPPYQACQCDMGMRTCQIVAPSDLVSRIPEADTAYSSTAVRHPMVLRLGDRSILLVPEVGKH
jgi:hypothetical protein